MHSGSFRCFLVFTAVGLLEGNAAVEAIRAGDWGDSSVFDSLMDRGHLLLDEAYNRHSCVQRGEYRGGIA